MVSEDRIFPVGSNSNDRAQHAGGVDQAELAVVSVAVWISERDELFFVAIRIDAENFVDLFIADVDEARFVPNRAFGKAEACGDGFEFRVF